MDAHMQLVIYHEIKNEVGAWLDREIKLEKITTIQEEDSSSLPIEVFIGMRTKDQFVEFALQHTAVHQRLMTLYGNIKLMVPDETIRRLHEIAPMVLDLDNKTLTKTPYLCLLPMLSTHYVTKLVGITD